MASEKSVGYERLAKDESTSSEDDDDGDDYDGDINENVLFALTNANSGTVKRKSVIPTLCCVACIAVVALTVFTLVVYFFRTKSATDYVKQPHSNLTQEVMKRYNKTPEWTMDLAGFGRLLSQMQYINFKLRSSCSR